MAVSISGSRTLLWLALCSAWFHPLTSQAAPESPRASVVSPWSPVQSVEGITEYRLPNGLQVLLIPDDSKPTTTVNITYRVGSRHENYGETGMAHLLEHLLFKGSKKHPQVWAEFNKRGFRANGTTWFDRTNYFASFAANEDNLKWYLSWQADAMVNSFIAQKDLDSEMTVVRNEMEMGENDPGRILFEKTLATMYQWHNYGKSTIGARADVEGVDIGRLRAFYRTYYQPDNATLIISGKFKPAQVMGWVQQYFGAIPKPQRAMPRMYTLDPVQDGERSVNVRRVGGVPLLYAGYHVVPGPHPDFAAVELLSLILGDTPSGRLHKALTEKQLAAGTFAFSEGLADPGFVLFGAQLGAGQDPAPASAALVSAVESLTQQPITQEELDRAKAKWLKLWDKGFADPQHIGVALSEAVAQGDWRLYFLLRDRVKSATLADVQRVAQQSFVASNRTIGQYTPTAEPARANTPQRVDVAAQLKSFKGQNVIAQAEAFDASPANIDARTQRMSLGTGLQVALLPKSTRGEAVQANLVLHFGTEKTLANWGEVPSAMAALLDKGTSQLGRQQIQDKLDALQSQVGIAASAGQLTVSIASKRAYFPQVLELVAEMLQHPVWPAEVLEEVRRQALASIEEQRKEPEAVLEEALSRHDNPYPKGDVRYACTFDEMVEDWRAVQVAQIKAFHERFVSASKAEFAAVGDFDPLAIKSVLERRLASWTKAEPYVRVPQPLLKESPTRMQLHTPDKQNASLMATLALPLNDRHPDYAALMLANHLLGSGGDSRLWNRIREKEGLSYSVYSAVQWNSVEENSQWVAAAIFAPQNRAKVEKALVEEIQRAVGKGFDASEFESGKKGLLSFRRLARAQDARLAAGWAANLHLNRTFAESARVDAALEAVTLAEVNAALKRYLKPDQLVMGVAGDFKSESAR